VEAKAQGAARGAAEHEHVYHVVRITPWPWHQIALHIGEAIACEDTTATLARASSCHRALKWIASDPAIGHSSGSVGFAAEGFATQLTVLESC
jgi:hypothetical protein